MTTNRSLPKTPLALAVLNLLNEAPMHPYEMQTKMRERGHERAIKVKPASVYDTVERLAKLGFVEPVETACEGRRPERTVYRLTPHGADEINVLRIFVIEDEYMQAMRRCEAAWLRGVVQELREGTLEWPEIADKGWE